MQFSLIGMRNGDNFEISVRIHILDFIFNRMSFILRRDYEVLNHQLLHTLIEKVNGMQRYHKLSWEEDSDLNWSSWLNSNLPEDEDWSEDHDYLVPEEVGENIITASSIKEYDLRQRHLH